MTIQGYVYDIESSEGLVGVKVTLLDNEGKKSITNTQTDKSGYFLLDEPTILSTDQIGFELIDYEKIKKEASELDDTKIFMTPKIEYLSLTSEDADIPLSPTEELVDKKNVNTNRNLLLLGGLAIVGIAAYYFSKNKKL